MKTLLALLGWVSAYAVLHWGLDSWYHRDELVFFENLCWVLFATATMVVMLVRVRAALGWRRTCALWFGFGRRGDGNQLMVGISQVALGAAIRMSWWEPWRYYRAVRDYVPGYAQVASERIEWFANHASYATLLAAMIACHGYVTHIHPALVQMFDKRWWLAPVIGMFIAAAVATKLVVPG